MMEFPSFAFKEEAFEGQVHASGALWSVELCAVPLHLRFALAFPCSITESVCLCVDRAIVVDKKLNTKLVDKHCAAHTSGGCVPQRACAMGGKSAHCTRFGPGETAGQQ